MNKSFISVSEALAKATEGETLVNYAVDFAHIKVEALDAMQLSKAGLPVPEEAIYYDDEATAPDEAFEEAWVRTEVLSPSAPVKQEIHLSLNEELQQWLSSQEVELDKLVENLLKSFYEAQKLLSKD